MDHRWPGARALVWLAPLSGTVLTVAVYRATYRDELGRYAGAEPALAGALVAAPFLTLALAQTACALAAGSTSPARRPAWTGAAAVLTTVGLVAAYLVLRA